MPQLTRSDVHVDRPLTLISDATLQDMTTYVNDKVFPVVPSVKQSDLYFHYPREYWFQTAATKVAPASETPGSGWHVSTMKFFCEEYGLHVDIADQIRQSEDDPIDMNRDATEFITQHLALRREKDFITRFMSPGVWGGLVTTNSAGILASEDFSPSVNWTNANSNPMVDVSKLISGVRRTTSKRINTMVVADDVNEALKQHPMVLDRIKYTETGIVTEDLLARLFGVDKYLVASAVENIAQEGNAGVFDFLVGGKMLLTYSQPSPGILKPSAGYTFAWTGQYGSSANGMRMKNIRMEAIEADRVEGKMAYDQHLVSPDLGVLGVNLLG
jgi:hypothetical protein